MSKDKSTKVLSIIALLVAVVGLTVAFAAMSTTLTINGTAKVKASTWDIHFANLDVAKTGKARANDLTNDIDGTTTGTKVTLADTAISGIQVELKEPGDKVVYDFDVINGGDIDAVLSSFTKSTNLSCAYADGSDSDATLTNVCSKINYTLTYGTEDGDEVEANDSNLDLIKTDNPTVTSNDSVKMYLTIEFDESAEVIPSKDILLTDSGEEDITIQMVYSQK